MAIAGYVEDPDNPRVYTEAAKEWQRARVRARRKDVTNETKLDYSPIIWPSPEGVRHAALVICGRFHDEPAVAREILEALAIPTVLRDGGGDGRVLRVQRGPVRLGEPDVPAIGYDPEDFGRPAPKRAVPRVTSLGRKTR